MRKRKSKEKEKEKEKEKGYSKQGWSRNLKLGVVLLLIVCSDFDF